MFYDLEFINYITLEMKIVRRHKIFSWLLAFAYITLLAHAFVPHHHHDDHTAFLNLKTCPHDHAHDSELHHHESHENQSAPCTGSSECVTLKHTLLKGVAWDTQDIENSTYPIAIITSGLQPVFSVFFTEIKTQGTPHTSALISKPHSTGWSYRGPPVLS